MQYKTRKTLSWLNIPLLYQLLKLINLKDETIAYSTALSQFWCEGSEKNYNESCHDSSQHFL